MFDHSLWSHYLGDHRYISGGTISGAGSLVNWFLEKIDGRFTLQELEKGLELVEIENAPIFLPFIFGEQSPGWKLGTYGGFMGDGHYECQIASDTEIFHMYYSILEGIGFNLKQSYNSLKKACDDIDQRVIKISGGVIKSSYWLQLLANIFERPIYVSNIQHQSLAGAIKIATLSMEERYLDDGINTKSKVILDAEDMAHPVSQEEDLRIYENRYVSYLKFYDELSRYDSINEKNIKYK